MGSRLSRVFVPFALLTGAWVPLLADEAEWQRQMDIALQSAARQNYSASVAAFTAAIRELEMSNPSDLRLGPTINNMGLVYRAANNLPQAEAAFRRAMTYIEKTTSPQSIDVGNSCLNVGS